MWLTWLAPCGQWGWRCWESMSPFWNRREWSQWRGAKNQWMVHFGVGLPRQHHANSPGHPVDTTPRLCAQKETNEKRLQLVSHRQPLEGRNSSMKALSTQDASCQTMHFQTTKKRKRFEQAMLLRLISHRPGGKRLPVYQKKKKHFFVRLEKQTLLLIYVDFASWPARSSQARQWAAVGAQFIEYLTFILSVRKVVKRWSKSSSLKAKWQPMNNKNPTITLTASLRNWLTENKATITVHTATSCLGKLVNCATSPIRCPARPWVRTSVGKKITLSPLRSRVNRIVQPNSLSTEPALKHKMAGKARINACMA